MVAGIGAIERRVAMPEDELHSMLFRLFETQEKWILKDLIRETDQPTAHLKRSLEALCEYKREVSAHIHCVSSPSSFVDSVLSPYPLTYAFRVGTSACIV